MTAGSTIPLVLGFFLIGLLVVAGAVLASDAFTRQRDLQSVCDGAAVAGANAIDAPAARTRGLATALPLAAVQAAVQRLPGRGCRPGERPGRGRARRRRRTVLADCHSHTRPAFAGLIGRPDGIDQHARSQARGIVQ